MDMTDLADNEFGIEYNYISVRKLRIFRVNNQWLVEYQRTPRAWAPWDYFWWYNDGQYVEYYDALARVDNIKADGYVKIARFQKVKTFEVEQ
jgi:hypothetical protein